MNKTLAKHPISIINQQVPRPAHRALRIQELGWQLTHSLLSNQIAATQLLFSRPSPQLWEEMSAMQMAVLQRMHEQQEEWLKGIGGVLTEYSEMKQANTLSRLLEQECNMASQLGSLATSQMTAWIGMLENIQIGYSWWLNQKQQALLEESRQTPQADEEEQVLDSLNG